MHIVKVMSASKIKFEGREMTRYDVNKLNKVQVALALRDWVFQAFCVEMCGMVEDI